MPDETISTMKTTLFKDACHFLVFLVNDVAPVTIKRRSFAGVVGNNGRLH